MSKKKKALIILGALVIVWIFAQPTLNDMATYDEGLEHKSKDGRLDFQTSQETSFAGRCAEMGGQIHNGKCQ